MVNKQAPKAQSGSGGMPPGHLKKITLKWLILKYINLSLEYYIE